MKIILNILGIILMLLFVYLISWKKKSILWKDVLKGIVIQLIIAIVLIKIPIGRIAILKVSDVITGIINCGNDGLAFVFGSLADPTANSGFIFAILVLGNIIFLSSLVSLLYYVGALGFIVKWIGKVVSKLMGTTEVESFVAVANMFLGQTDSPILVSKYLKNMTDSEIMVVLISGMGSMSASILGGYVALGIPMEYLLIASTLVPIGSILVSKIILPQTETTASIHNVKMDNKGNNNNIIDAVVEGAITGMNMAFSIGASLIAIIALVTLLNKILGVTNITLQQVFSYIFAPVGFFMGLDDPYVFLEGSLLGSKLTLNEFIAFQELGTIISKMDPRTAIVSTISLCGFANFSSLGICVAGISVLCPEKKSTLSNLVFRAMLGGVVVSILSAMIVGLVMLF